MSGNIDVTTREGFEGATRWLTGDAIIPCAKGRVEYGHAVLALLAERDELRAAVANVLPLLDLHRGHTLTKGDELNIDSVHEQLTTAARLCDICGALDTKPYPAYPEHDGLAGFVDYLCDEHSDLARPEGANS